MYVGMSANPIATRMVQEQHGMRHTTAPHDMHTYSPTIPANVAACSAHPRALDGAAAATQAPPPILPPRPAISPVVLLASQAMRVQQHCNKGLASNRARSRTSDGALVMTGHYDLEFRNLQVELLLQQQKQIKLETAKGRGVVVDGTANINDNGNTKINAVDATGTDVDRILNSRGMQGNQVGVKRRQPEDANPAVSKSPKIASNTGSGNDGGNGRAVEETNEMFPGPLTSTEASAPADGPAVIDGSSKSTCVL